MVTGDNPAEILSPNIYLMGEVSSGSQDIFIFLDAMAYEQIKRIFISQNFGITPSPLPREHLISSSIRLNLGNDGDIYIYTHNMYNYTG